VNGELRSALRASAPHFGPLHPVEMENPMTKPWKTKPAQTRFVVYLGIDLGRVRWIEPIPQSTDWWPLPWPVRGQGGR
jgi:hypothetical protein